jgi:hypothetical protein
LLLVLGMEARVSNTLSITVPLSSTLSPHFYFLQGTFSHPRAALHGLCSPADA